MRTRNIVGSLAPLLVCAAPLFAQQQPAPRPKPAVPAPAKPTSSPKPVAAPAPAPVPAAGSVSTLARIGERRPLVEITGGIGTAIVDLNSWSGGTVNGSSKLAYWGAGRVLFPVGSSLRIGAEVGYHYHFWYTSPSGVGYNYTYPAAAWHVAGLVRLPVAPRFTADVGAVLHFFNTTRPGVVGALSYSIPVGASVVIPLGVRADVIFTNPTLVTPVLNAGIGFGL